MKSPSSSLRDRIPGPLLALAEIVFVILKFFYLYLERTWASSYLFSVIFISLILSKSFHIFAHFSSLPLLSLLFWGATFFLTEVLFILVACFFTRFFESRIARGAAAVGTAAFALYASGMISANISYYCNIGVEIHWRQAIEFRGAKPSAKLIISALAVAVITETFIWVGAYFATPRLYRFTSCILEIWVSFLPAGLTKYCRPRKPALQETYEQIALHDSEDSDSDSVAFLDQPEVPPQETSRPLVMRLAVAACGVAFLALRVIRPNDLAYSFYSESLPLAIFHTSSHWRGISSVEFLPGNFTWLRDHTALDRFPTFDWLPVSEAGSLPPWSPFHINMTRQSAFSDGPVEHYNPLKDPLHIPNLDNDILESIKGPIQDGSVKIKHIILVKLESTRQDAWPMRADSMTVDRVRESRKDEKIPEPILEALANLTPTAERLTGWETGFETGKERPTPYGGISASNAYTSGTYTLKSLTGTICGVSPMPVEGNREYVHDIYQPCLPHIFESLNEQGNITSSIADDWTSWPWHTMWMQSHSAEWDRHWALNPVLGFKDIMIKETIDQTDMKYIPEETEEEEHHGHEDKVLKNYLRDVVADAKRNNTRLFLAHLTHNTHNPWFKPGEPDVYLSDASEGTKKNINNYINTLQYQDQWVADILEVLEEAEIADETLLIMAGDHGLSLPDNGGLTANHDSHVTSFHVPLYFSHPKLPQIEITNPVISTQILPTLLDLLIETGSANEQSLKVFKDLLPLYEGQSMLRAPIPEKDGRKEWQFSTMNPGGTWISARSASHPYRLVVPLKPDAMWRFSDPSADPRENFPEEDVDILDLIDIVQTRYGPEAAKWANEAAHAALWWIEDNHRRWKYDPNNEILA